MAQARKRQPVRFDSLRASQDLGETGMPPEQATGVVNMVVQVVNDNLATTEDIGRIESDTEVLKVDVAGLKSDVANLKIDVAGLKTDVAGLKTDVANLKTDVADLKLDVKAIQNAIFTRFRWTVGVQFAVGALIITILEFLR